MSRWGAHKNSVNPDTNDMKIEIEGIETQCELCQERTDTTWYLPEVKALTWKCAACQHINIITDFYLPQ